jgi:tetratricopeptide (TPR) repeat protein
VAEARSGARSPNACVCHGIEWLARGEHAHAFEEFNEAIRLDPRSVLAYHFRGVARLRRSMDYRSTGDTRLSAGEIDRAIEDFDQAIQLDPNYADAYVNRAQARILKAHELRGRPRLYEAELRRAITDADRAIQLEYGQFQAYNTRGAARLLLKECDRAVGDFDRAIQVAPSFAPAFANRGTALQEQGKYGPALADYEAALELDQRVVDAHSGLAWLLATCPLAKYRDGKRAVVEATRACELTGWKEGHLFDYFAAAYAEVGDFEKAVEWQSKALQSLPESEPDVKKYRARLDLYRARKPYREHPGAD